MNTSNQAPPDVMIIKSRLPKHPPRPAVAPTPASASATFKASSSSTLSTSSSSSSMYHSSQPKLTALEILCQSRLYDEERKAAKKAKKAAKKAKKPKDTISVVPKKIHQCTQCDHPPYPGQSGLWNHMNSIHGASKQPKKTYFCDRCGKDCKKKSNLDAHKKRKNPCANLVAVVSKMAGADAGVVTKSNINPTGIIASLITPSSVAQPPAKNDVSLSSSSTSSSSNNNVFKKTHQCPHCPNLPPYSTDSFLSYHMKRDHDVKFCRRPQLVMNEKNRPKIEGGFASERESSKGQTNASNIRTTAARAEQRRLGQERAKEVTPHEEAAKLQLYNDTLKRIQNDTKDITEHDAVYCLVGSYGTLFGKDGGITPENVLSSELCRKVWDKELPMILDGNDGSYLTRAQAQQLVSDGTLTWEIYLTDHDPALIDDIEKQGTQRLMIKHPIACVNIKAGVGSCQRGIGPYSVCVLTLKNVRNNGDFFCPSYESRPTTYNGELLSMRVRHQLGCSLNAVKQQPTSVEIIAFANQSGLPTASFVQMEKESRVIPEGYGKDGKPSENWMDKYDTGSRRNGGCIEVEKIFENGTYFVTIRTKPTSASGWNESTAGFGNLSCSNNMAMMYMLRYL
jgi:hypothetical protein